ncbi:CbiX/SirB N-terminal domain-containing protein, partial [Kitasatospora nipponensis]|uniref:CbiX/SirB N-terminal domain-containing protein n=1 Tax=Kitasatospora nipponensis TaxID=258049 RepID=UPI0031DB8D29
RGPPPPPPPPPNAATRALAADWQRRRGWGAVEVAYASAGGPRVPDAAAALRARGLRRTEVAPYLLAPGLLPDPIAAAAVGAGADLLAPVLGAAPEIAELVLTRFEAAAAGGNGLRGGPLSSPGTAARSPGPRRAARAA